MTQARAATEDMGKSTSRCVPLTSRGQGGDHVVDLRLKILLPCVPVKLLMIAAVFSILLNAALLSMATHAVPCAASGYVACVQHDRNQQSTNGMTGDHHVTRASGSDWWCNKRCTLNLGQHSQCLPPHAVHPTACHPVTYVSTPGLGRCCGCSHCAGPLPHALLVHTNVRDTNARCKACLQMT